MTDKPKDEADKYAAGDLTGDAFVGTERMRPKLPAKVRQLAAEECDMAAERALLGALLWAGANAPDQLRVTAVLEYLENGQAFYGRGHGDVYESALECAVEKVEHDPVAVNSRLVAAGKDRFIGGLDGLLALKHEASTVSEVQAREFAARIRAAWAKRVSVCELRALIEDARRPGITAEVLYERSAAASVAMASRSSMAAKSVSLRQSAESLFRRLMTGKNTAMATGLRDVDGAMNGGMRPGEVTILAARTSVGKSVLSAQIAEHMVTTQPNAAALYVTLEMAHESFTARMLAARANVPMSNLRKVALTPTHWKDITAAVAELSEKGVYFTDSTSQTLASVYATALERKRVLAQSDKRLVLIVIDHIGLVKPSADALKRANREQQVAETSRGLRFIAAELGVHVIGIAQIGRAAEAKGDVMPRLHHLRESGAIEMDPDTVLIMHRERDAKSGLFRTDKPPALAVAKARLDETAIFLLRLNGVRFSDWDGTEAFSDFYGAS
jgi:replicative DNA helicase